MKAALMLCLCCVIGGAAPAGFTEKYRAGIRWMEQGQWQLAEDAFADALTYRESPDARRMSRICRFNLYLEGGLALLKEHRYESAVEQFQRALDLDSQSRPALDGLRSAQYQAAYRNGVSAFAMHQDNSARRFFERCLEIRPDDDAARRQLQAIDTWRTSWEQVNSCLTEQNAACLDRRIPALAASGRSDLPLLPALLDYQRGDLRSAEAAARNLTGEDAVRFRTLLRAAARKRFAERWAPWSAGLYVITLAASLYCGLRQTRARQLSSKIV
jgi:tetratricopeptide (TPR) repeat protein